MQHKRPYYSKQAVSDKHQKSAIFHERTCNAIQHQLKSLPQSQAAAFDQICLWPLRDLRRSEASVFGEHSTVAMQREQSVG